VLCIAGLFLWHLVVYLAGKLTKPKTFRHALEPRPAIQSPKREQAGAGIAQPDQPDAVARAVQTSKQLVAQVKSDPEQLQQVCAALEDSLAEIYLELAESWLRKGSHEQAAAALQKILQSFPNSRYAQVAHDRLRQIGGGSPAPTGC
jgi:tetratricopeptide (TPR) repeat protein